jgi:hypothetical protein
LYQLKDGVALLRVFKRIFPLAVDMRKAKIAERPKYDDLPFGHDSIILTAFWDGVLDIGVVFHLQI